MKNPRERREFQRLKLRDSMPAQYGNRSVRVLDLGIPGARIEHEGPLKSGTSATLSFAWNGQPVQIDAEVVRSVIAKASPSLVRAPDDPASGAHAVYQTGLQFLSANGDSGAVLRRLLSEAVRQLLEEYREVGAQNNGAATASEEEDTVRARNFGFLCYTLEQGVWKKRRLYLPEQPEVGFTVAASEDKEELQRICRAYEQADEEGRRLIRLFAELSVSEALNLPHGS